MTTKKLATWKPTAENRPVPVNVRLVAKECFNWVSSVGEASAGEITMVSPDYSQHVTRYKCTRSYDFKYMCLSCKRCQSVLEPDSITIVISDQFYPDILPPNTNVLDYVLSACMA